MIEAMKEFRICYAHRLHGHPGPCRHLHGHNGVLRIFVRAEGPDRLGMAADFSEIKDAMEPLALSWDHAVLLAEDDPLADVLDSHGERVRRLPCPPSAEMLAREALRFARARGLAAHRAEWQETDSCMGACEGPGGQA